jgi:hypothetical protein
MENKKILIHASPIEIKKLVYKNQSECKFALAGLKPCGLWFSPGKEWLDWCRKILPDHCESNKYFYVVVPKYTTLENPDKNKVLKIQNENDFDNFNFKYGDSFYDEKGSGGVFIKIKWINVEKDFGGIEIIPFLKNRSYLFGNPGVNIDELKEKYNKNNLPLGDSFMGTMWYISFDIASGCIWNPDAIKKFYRIKKKIFKYVNGENTKKLFLVRIK